MYIVCDFYSTFCTRGTHELRTKGNGSLASNKTRNGNIAYLGLCIYRLCIFSMIKLFDVCEVHAVEEIRPGTPMDLLVREGSVGTSLYLIVK